MIEADFQCRDCGLSITVARMSISDPVLPPLWCDCCGGTSFKRVFIRAAVIFSGDGWACKS